MEWVSDLGVAFRVWYCDVCLLDECGIPVCRSVVCIMISISLASSCRCPAERTVRCQSLARSSQFFLAEGLLA